MTFRPAGIAVFLVSVLFTFGVSEGCHSQLDCQANECCVTNNQPIGKRMLLIVTGHCQPLGKEGSNCLTRYGSASTPPSGVVTSCPCEDHLTCYDVPLEESGVCTHHH